MAPYEDQESRCSEGGESVIRLIVWVGDWLTFYQQPNGLMPSQVAALLVAVSL